MAEISCLLGMRLDLRMYKPGERVAIVPALTRPRAVLSLHGAPAVRSGKKGPRAALVPKP